MNRQTNQNRLGKNSFRPGQLVILAGAAMIAACQTATTPALEKLPPNGCPLAGWNWVRWNDVYGLNVVGIVQAYPGWTFSFAPAATVINHSAGPASEVELDLRPRRIDVAHPPKTSDQHVYGYWPHKMLGVKPNRVQVRCGQLIFQPSNSTPRDLFNPDPPEAPPPMALAAPRGDS